MPLPARARQPRARCCSSRGGRCLRLRRRGRGEGLRGAPMVGIVVTISPSFSLYRMVVLPAASRPTWRGQPGCERLARRGAGWRLTPSTGASRAAPRRSPGHSAAGAQACPSPPSRQLATAAWRPSRRSRRTAAQVAARDGRSATTATASTGRLRPREAAAAPCGRRATRHEDAHLALAEQLREQLRG